MGAAEAKAITQRQLTALAKRWQKKLRLMDWKIKVKLAGEEEFNAAGIHLGVEVDTAFGFNEMLPTAKTCKIWILKPSDIPPTNGLGNPDLEDTVVHELLHLHFVGLAREEDDIMVEQAIDAITGALVGKGENAGS